MDTLYTPTDWNLEADKAKLRLAETIRFLPSVQWHTFNQWGIMYINTSEEPFVFTDTVDA